MSELSAAKVWLSDLCSEVVRYSQLMSAADGTWINLFPNLVYHACSLQGHNHRDCLISSEERARLSQISLH